MERLSSAFDAIVSWWRSWRVTSARYREARRRARSNQRNADRERIRADGWLEEHDRLVVRLAERDREIANLRGEREVLESQIELLTAVVQRELERLEAETAMQAARKVRALNNSMPAEEDESL